MQEIFSCISTEISTESPVWFQVPSVKLAHKHGALVLVYLVDITNARGISVQPHWLHIHSNRALTENEILHMGLHVTSEFIVFYLILWIGLSHQVFGQHIRRQRSVTENLYMAINWYKNMAIFYNIFCFSIIPFKIIVEALLATFYIKNLHSHLKTVFFPALIGISR